MEKYEGIDYLNYLEKTGKYVFHGSPFGGIDTLVPKQGRHFPNPKDSEEFILDGDPAVSATPYAEFAIFRALINKNNTPNVRSGFGFNNKEKEFRVSNQKVLDAIKDKKGFVYVFDKSNFEPYSRNGKAHEGNMEWRAYKEVKPKEIIEVQYDDLKQIETIVQFTEAN